MIKKLLKEVSNIPGTGVKQKYVVIESDDWGSSRVDSPQMSAALKKAGYAIDKCWMSSYDAIERNNDLEALFGVLESNRDKNGNAAVFTMLFNPANPDFEKIREAGFSDYFYKPFTETLKNYNGTDKVPALYQEAINGKLTAIEFHGREHLYTGRWLRDLRNGKKVALEGFGLGFWGFSKSYVPDLVRNYRPAFDLDTPEDIPSQEQAIREGAGLIGELFNISPRFFVAPDGPYSLKLNKALADSGIKYIGLSKSHLEPQGDHTTKKLYFHIGKTINHGLTVLTRNAIFEPGKRNGTDWVASCLKDMESAFRWNKPAVISTHRANYIGVHSADFRDKNLKDLDVLLKSILKKWPDAQFITSAELGAMIENKK